MNATIERRSAGLSKPTISKRADGASVITGYASVFYDPSNEADTQYDLGYGMIERIMPTAFNRAISEKQDVRGLMNHDENKLLGRTTSGTMALSVDSKGLRYEITLNPADPDHVATEQKLARGDLTGSSFGFIPKVATWKEVNSDQGDQLYREIEDVDLFDVGPVTFPAYTGATSGLRSGDRDTESRNLRADANAWKAKQAAGKRSTLNAVESRLREIQIQSDDLA